MAASVVMGYRVVRDSLAAEVGTAGAVLLGIFFAMVVAVLSFVVASTVYHDGSPLTEEQEHLSRQLARIKQHRERLARQRDRQVGQLDLLIVQAQQVRTLTILKMSGPIKGADQLRAIARSLHQACGWGTEFLPAQSDSFGLFAPGVQVDTSALDGLIQQLEATAVSRPAADAGEGQPSTSANRAASNGHTPAKNDDAVSSSHTD